MYEDRLIEDGKLEPDLWDGLTPLNNAEGLPRELRLDGLWSQQRRNDLSTSQWGVGVGGFLGTPQYGAFSFDGLFTNGNDTSLATLWQRDMPFDDGWRASNALGMLNTPAIDLVRFQPRIFLPTTPMVGALTEWRSPQGTMLTAGYGQPGVYVGAYVPEFRRLGGVITNLGAQWTDGGQLTAGFQYAGASDVTSAFQDSPDAQQFSTRSFVRHVASGCDQPLPVQCAPNGEHIDAVTPRRLVRRRRAVGPLCAFVRAVLARAGPRVGQPAGGER